MSYKVDRWLGFETQESRSLNPLRRRMLTACCVFAIVYSLGFIVFFYDQSIAWLHGYLALISIVFLGLLHIFPQRFPNLPFYYITLSFIGELSAFYIGLAPLSLLLQWAPVMVAVICLTNRERFGLVFTFILVTTCIVFLVTRGEGLIRLEMQQYDQQAFFALLVSHIGADVYMAMLFLTFERDRQKTEEHWVKQKLENAKILHTTVASDLVGDLAHEINNPLAILQSALFQLDRLNGTIESRQRTRLLEFMEQSVARIDTVHERMKSIAKEAAQ